MTLRLRDDDVLLVVDVQNDFCPGGALAVPDGDGVVAPANLLASRFRQVILTQDWHPRRHSSFASAHPGKRPFDKIDLSYGEQILWPDHCIQGSRGADLHAGLHIPHATLLLRKGWDPAIDSYSVFRENDRLTPTGLAGYLRERAFSRLFIAGLALDFCVGWSALDGTSLGFQILVIEDACRGIDIGGSVAAIWREMAQAGVQRVFSDVVRR